MQLAIMEKLLASVFIFGASSLSEHVVLAHMNISVKAVKIHPRLFDLLQKFDTYCKLVLK